MLTVEKLSEQIAQRADEAPKLYHRLVVVVGPARTGKTAALLELEAGRGWPLVNINLALSERLLELTSRQRTRRVARLLNDIIGETAGQTVMLDNIEMLFHPALKQAPLRLLQGLSRNRTLIATWRGVYERNSLIYGSPTHPEFRRVEAPQEFIVSTSTRTAVGAATTSAQEQPT